MLDSRLLFLAVAVAWSSFAVCACSSDSHPAAIEGCEGKGCVPEGSQHNTVVDAGVEDGEVGSDAAADAEGVALSGKVVRIADTFLTGAVAYTGSGTLQVPTASGDSLLSFASGGDFSATKVAPGYGWFRVRPNEADAGDLASVLSTYAHLNVPSTGATGFTVPVLDREMLTTIYFGLAGAPIVRTDAAQVVFAFFRNGQPVSGVQITGAPTNAGIAYDDSSSYSTLRTATGSRGIAILVNVTGAGDVTLKYDTGVTKKFIAVYAQGEGSYVEYEVP